MVLGELSVTLSDIEPPEPEVGDEVTFTFSVASRLPGFFDCTVGSCAFIGGPPQLAGDDPPVLQVGGIVVRRRAVEAGMTTVQLDLMADTEEVCLFEDETGCHEIFQPAFIEATTGPIEVEIQQAPTATPTVTPMHRPVDDDGCAVVPADPASAGAIAILLVPALLVIARRR
jgi:hypothetical protein